MNTFKTFFLLFISTFFLLTSCKDSPSKVVSGVDLLPVADFNCTNGFSDDLFPCNNISMYAHLTNNELGGFEANDIWGWTDPTTNKEYALVGLTDGVSFVDISDPSNPVVVGKLEESSIAAKYKVFNDPDFEACLFGIGNTKAKEPLAKGSVWRDHKVYNDHLFVVSDAQAHGMQVFDLTRLRSYTDTLINFTHDAFYDEIANAHNIVINESSSFAYIVGATNTTGENTCDGGGLHIVDISDPLNPTFAGCYADTEPPRRRANSAYIHDAQCVTYDGPDTEHAGKEVCFSSAEQSTVITDVSDKQNPQTIGFGSNPNVQYSHQGWLTEDHSYFFMNDELDEINLQRKTRTHIFNVKDLDNPVYVGYYQHTTNAIDHNLYVRDNYLYQSNYSTGLRVFEIGNLDNLELTEVAYFDTYASSNIVDFNGAWSNYPFFESGVIIVSDIESGLFILKPEF